MLGATWFSLRCSVLGHSPGRGTARPHPALTGVGTGARGLGRTRREAAGRIPHPGPGAPAVGTVGLVLVSAPPAPRAFSRLREPPRIPVVPPPGRDGDAGRRQTATRRGRQTRGQAPAREGGVPEDLGQQPVGRPPKEQRYPVLRCATNQWGRATPSELGTRDFGRRTGNLPTLKENGIPAAAAAGTHGFRFLGLSLSGRDFQAIV